MAQPDLDFSQPILAAAAEVAAKVHANAVFAYVSGVTDPGALRQALKKPTKLILVARNEEERQRAESTNADVLQVPPFGLTRMGQVKMATIIAFSQQLLNAGDVFVFLTGVAGAHVDTLVAMRVGQEYELFQSVGQQKLTDQIRRPVFERVLRIALELANEGREGRPVGALFVLGDLKEVQKYFVEGRINPFRGYTEKERNILDESIGDTVKEIAKLDGAFIVKGNGVIVAACATLRPGSSGEDLAQRFGARHAAAAGITASTKCIAITLSESTGDVRVWRRGQMITEIERSARSSGEGAPPAVHQT